MKRKPLVSIVIPNYNYGLTLRECLDSAVNQTYSNIEILFIDNGSNDDSMKIAKSYRKKGVKVFKNKYNIGVRSHNKIASLAKGEYIHILHSDDVVEPTFVEECIELMEENENVAVTVTERSEIDGNSQQIGEFLPFYNCSCIIPGIAQKAVLAMASYYVPSQTVFRTEVFRKAGQYDIHFFMDWWMLFLATNYGDVGCIHKPLMKYRIWASTETGYMVRNLLMPFSGYLIRQAIIDVAKLRNEIMVIEREEASMLKQADLTLKLAVDLLRIDMLEVARQYLHIAMFQSISIESSQLYKGLKSYIDTPEIHENESIDVYLNRLGLAGKRNQSYDPPSGYVLYQGK